MVFIMQSMAILESVPKSCWLPKVCNNPFMLKIHYIFVTLITHPIFQYQDQQVCLLTHRRFQLLQ